MNVDCNSMVLGQAYLLKTLYFKSRSNNRGNSIRNFLRNSSCGTQAPIRNRHAQNPSRQKYHSGSQSIITYWDSTVLRWGNVVVANAEI